MSGKVLLSFWYFNLFKEWSFKLGELRWVTPTRWLATPKDWVYPELGSN
jgi:hypothetical protein